MNFREVWLPKFLEDYQNLKPDEKEETIKQLLTVLGPKEKWLLQTTLPDFLFRDFIIDLPDEIAELILKQLSFQDLINCCLVSKAWNVYISTTMSAVWKHQASQLGMNVKSRPERSWKDCALRGASIRDKLKKGSCFKHQTKTVNKTNRKVIAISIDQGHIAVATGDSSGPYEVCLMNIQDSNFYPETAVFLVPPSVVKLNFPNRVFIGHVDGTITDWTWREGQSTDIRGHTSYILSIDVNQVTVKNQMLL